jgi:Stage II sporulation protein E (SpoIIE)
MSVDSYYHPVRSIGGDFALVNSTDHEHLSLFVCDVSGHGIGSALVANRIYSETAAHLRSGMPFLDIFRELNRFLIEDIAGSGMYVTVAAARINARQRSLVFAGAGHPPAMLARRGKIQPLIEDFRKTSAKANPALDHIDAMVRENRADVRKAVVELRRTLTNMTDASARIDQRLDVNSENIDEVLDNIRRVTENLKEFTATIKTRPYRLIRANNPPDHKPGEKP